MNKSENEIKDRIGKLIERMGPEGNLDIGARIIALQEIAWVLYGEDYS